MSESSVVSDNQDIFLCVDHVGYAVPDMDAAVKLHTEVLGWHVVFRGRNEEQGVEEVMLATNGHDYTDRDAEIQLLAPLSEDSTIGKWLAKNGGRGGIQQVAYRVADVEKAAEVLASRGVTMLYDAPKHGTYGSRINFCHPKSTGGILLELVERPAEPEGFLPIS